ncbi:capping complex subunit for YIEGIA [Bacillus niameyensis]|uniref:capping complex subunit for YIEGIA n=1 Tax=Bacillus niameyensis TaxID=1522308 RepID=UPI0007812430|nr:hypothetical protein [Bacillus niameyensis]
MADEKQTAIIAIVTTKAGHIQGGGSPVFIVDNNETAQKMGKRLERIMDSSAHELDENTIIIVSR